MEREEIKVQVVKQLKELMNYSDAIEEETYLCEDLDIGSLEVFELIAELEDEYDITISSDLAKSFVQVKDIIDFLEKTLNEDQHE